LVSFDPLSSHVTDSPLFYVQHCGVAEQVLYGDFEQAVGYVAGCVVANDDLVEQPLQVQQLKQSRVIK
jgi:hypothetical protein